MKALLFRRNEVRYAAAMLTSRLAPGEGARFGPLSLADVEVPELPAEGWHHVTPLLSGICASDLATIDAYKSRLAAWKADLADLAAKRRASYVDLTSDVNLAELMFAELRRRRVLG